MQFFRHLRNSKNQADAARNIGKTSEPERRVLMIVTFSTGFGGVNPRTLFIPQFEQSDY